MYYAMILKKIHKAGISGVVSLFLVFLMQFNMVVSAFTKDTPERRTSAQEISAIESVSLQPVSFELSKYDKKQLNPFARNHSENYYTVSAKLVYKSFSQKLPAEISRSVKERTFSTAHFSTAT